MKMKMLFAAICTVLNAMAQTTVGVGNLTVSSDATAALNGYLIGQYQVVSTRLSINATELATEIRVDGAQGIGVNDTIRIDLEAMLITAKSGRDLTVTRAAFGTLAVPHLGQQTVVNPDSSTTIIPGVEVRLLKFANFRQLFRQWIIEATTGVMDVQGYPSLAAQETAISTAKQAAKAAAVQ